MPDLGAASGILGNLSIAPIISFGKVLGRSLLFIGVGAAVFFWMFLQLRFKDKIILIARRGNQNVITHDRGGLFKTRKGDEYYKLKKEKARISVPDYSYYQMDNRGRRVLYIYKYAEHSYVPIRAVLCPAVDLKGTEVQLTPVDIEMKNETWSGLMAMKEKWDKKSKLEKIMIPAMFMGMIAAFILMVYWMKGEISSLISIGARVADTCISQPASII